MLADFDQSLIANVRNYLSFLTLIARPALSLLISVLSYLISII